MGKMKGADRLQRKLKAMPAAIRAELEKAVLQGAQNIAGTARALVPTKSGALKASIGAVLGDAPPTRATQAIRTKRSSKADPSNIYATTFAGDDEAYYAAWVENGTAPHEQPSNRFNGGEHPGSVAQPFFYPAVRANKKRNKSLITRAIHKAAKKVAKS